MKNIDIFTALATTSPAYADYLAENLIGLSSGKNLIRFWSICNQKFDYPVPPTVYWENMGFVDTPEGITNSHTHALSLNCIANFIPADSDVVIVVDCDVAVLQHNWDELIVNELQNTHCIGTPKHKGTLSVYFTAFRSEVYRKIHPNFLPGDNKEIAAKWHTISNDKESQYLGIKKGEKIVLDTGWRVAKQLAKKGYTFKLFEYVYSDKGVPKYLYKHKGNPFVTHFGGSHKKAFSSDLCKQWKGYVEGVIKKNKKKRFFYLDNTKIDIIRP